MEMDDLVNAQRETGKVKGRCFFINYCFEKNINIKLTNCKIENLKYFENNRGTSTDKDVFAVTNRGSGISYCDARKIFRMHHQVPNAVTYREKKTYLESHQSMMRIHEAQITHSNIQKETIALFLRLTMLLCDLLSHFQMG